MSNYKLYKNDLGAWSISDKPYAVDQEPVRWVALNDGIGRMLDNLSGYYTRMQLQFLTSGTWSDELKSHDCMVFLEGMRDNGTTYRVYYRKQIKPSVIILEPGTKDIFLGCPQCFFIEILERSDLKKPQATSNVVENTTVTQKVAIGVVGGTIGLAGLISLGTIFILILLGVASGLNELMHAIIPAALLVGGVWIIAGLVRKR